jgi:putative hydrolase of the HAD superfamily
VIKAVFFDFGGVILSSPFEAFARYEVEHGLPEGFIRTVNSTNPDDNAWARFERSEVDFDRFCDLFEDECRELGQEVAAREVIPLLAGEIRPVMVEAVRRCAKALTTACLTNNWAGFEDRADEQSGILGLFHHVIESSKVGIRKPDPAFYELACRTCDVRPEQVVFLDDLGVNLKPARAMGMTTIKVLDPAQAITDLEAVLGFRLS